MALERLEVQYEGPVARIWLNRPEVRNAFDGLMVTELRTTLFDMRTVDSVRVIVLGGRGPAFSAGADLQWMKAMAGFSREENLREAQALADLFFTVYESPKPVVARVQARRSAAAPGWSPPATSRWPRWARSSGSPRCAWGSCPRSSRPTWWRRSASRRPASCS